MRLIDADAIRLPDDLPYKASVKRVLIQAPTIDAVPVVRCKDCKHYHQYHVGKMKEPSGWGKCKLIDMDVDMTVNDFCSRGERKDNGDNQHE